MSAYRLYSNRDRTSRQTQAGIGHRAPAQNGIQVQNRSRRREQKQDRAAGAATTSRRTTKQVGERGQRQAGPVHTADDTPSNNAANRARHCQLRHRGRRPSAAAGSRGTKSIVHTGIMMANTWGQRHVRMQLMGSLWCATHGYPSWISCGAQLMGIPHGYPLVRNPCVSLWVSFRARCASEFAELTSSGFRLNLRN